MSLRSMVRVILPDKTRKAATVSRICPKGRLSFLSTGRHIVVPFALFASAVITAGGAADKTTTNVPLNIKVGLWQMTYTTERNGVAVVHSIAPELLAKMTPEQRARTEARLKARATQGAQVETRQYCITEERLNKALFDRDEGGSSCQRTTSISTAKLQQFSEECNEGNSKRLVDAHFEGLDADTMKGSLKVKAEGSIAYTMNVEIAGRWVAADCGNDSR